MMDGRTGFWPGEAWLETGEEMAVAAAGGSETPDSRLGDCCEDMR